MLLILLAFSHANMTNAMTKRVCFGKLYREHPARLRGMEWKETEDGFQAAHRPGVPVRLRQVPPVIADKVIDLMRFVSRGTDEEKW